jgi:hypothetical protein
LPYRFCSKASRFQRFRVASSISSVKMSTETTEGTLRTGELHDFNPLRTLSVCLSVCLSVYLSIYLWLYSPLLDLGRFFNFFIFYTDGRAPWTSNQPVARPVPTHRTTQTQNNRTQTSMPQVGFEPMIPVFERAKTVHALNRAPTVIGSPDTRNQKYQIKENEMNRACSMYETSKMLTRF